MAHYGPQQYDNGSFTYKEKNYTWRFYATGDVVIYSAAEEVARFKYFDRNRDELLQKITNAIDRIGKGKNEVVLCNIKTVYVPYVEPEYNFNQDIYPSE